ncbi:hypothetical protein QG37_07202 [Candidozyma auris]|uniref:Uncharacterized protein n=1 Tax=Candidozyma auris TaxID=498019 RepID=A0A0L0NS18_CANAR|nr:hypothetical protein QG37_07202 [[Candida] auris]
MVAKRAIEKKGFITKEDSYCEMNFKLQMNRPS